MTRTGVYFILLVFCQTVMCSETNMTTARIMDMQGRIYTGVLMEYTKVTLTFLSTTADSQIVTIPLDQIREIIYRNVTLHNPISFDQMRAVIPLPGTGTEGFVALEQRYRREIFPRCYDDRFLLQIMDSINTMNDDSYAGIHRHITDCIQIMDSIGIIENPCENMAYKTLHRSVLTSLSNRELDLLKRLRSNCFLFQEEYDWGYNFCSDSVYTSLMYKQQTGEFNFRQANYLEQLRNECHEFENDNDNSWLPGSSGSSKVIFEEPHSYKAFQTIGGLLLLPGFILPIASGVILNNVEPQLENLYIGGSFVRFLGWIALGAGIGCDCASIALLSISGVKKKENIEFQRIKEEYHQYKKKTADFSINLTVDF